MYLPLLKYQININVIFYKITFQSLSNDRMQSNNFMSENKTIVSLQPLKMFVHHFILLYFTSRRYVG